MAQLGFTSISSLIAQRGINRASKDLSISSERLASGLRINRSSDDAAGLAIASSLNLRSRVFAQAVRNANDGISALSVAQGALTETTGILSRLRELATGAANGSLSRSQRLSLDTESYALTNEFNRIIGGTSFNGLKLLDGSFTELAIQLGFGTSGRIHTNLTQELDRNVGNGFQTARVHNGGMAINTFDSAAADFNNDGKQDVVAGTNSSGYFISYGNGDGYFQDAVAISSANAASNYVITGDFNGDGLADFASVGTASNLNIRLNNGNGTFGQTNYATAFNAESLVVGDFNGDGRTDVALGSGTAAVQVFLNSGNGGYSAGTSYGGSTLNRSIRTADINGDGLLDLITAQNTTLNARLGNSDGSFGAAIQTTTTGNPADIAVGDFNHDGLPDVISATSSALYLSLGRGDGTFGSATLLFNGASEGIAITDISVADFNNDGNLDYSVTENGLARNYTSLGNGDGSFAGPSSVTLNVGRNYSTTGDFNNDGVLDIIGSGGGTSIEVLMGNVSTSTSIQRLDLTTQETARQALSVIDAALERVSRELGNIGGAQSRLESALNTVTDSRDNYSIAAGRITDVDVAEEVARMVRSQVLQDAATAVLAQANQTSSILLQLLT